jgi:hypothetical protein
MLGFEPIVEGGTAFILFAVMIVAIYITLKITISK